MVFVYYIGSHGVLFYFILMYDLVSKGLVAELEIFLRSIVEMEQIEIGKERKT